MGYSGKQWVKVEVIEGIEGIANGSLLEWTGIDNCSLPTDAQGLVNRSLSLQGMWGITYCTTG